MPDWQGWTHEDASFSNGNHWHVSTYWPIRNLGTVGQLRLYCGDETIPPCDPPDTIGGDGDSWTEEIEWRQLVSTILPAGDLIVRPVR